MVRQLAQPRPARHTEQALRSASRQRHPAQSKHALANECFTVSPEKLLDLIWIRFLNQPDRVVFRVPDDGIEAHHINGAAVDEFRALEHFPSGALSAALQIRTASHRASQYS